MAIELDKFLKAQIDRLERNTPEHADLPYLRRLYASNKDRLAGNSHDNQNSLVTARKALEELIERDTFVRERPFFESMSDYSIAIYREAMSDFGEDCVYSLIPPYASHSTRVFHVLSRAKIYTKEDLAKSPAEELLRLRNNGDTTRKWIFAIRDIAREELKHSSAQK